ncbi:MAG: ABC transporter ATP-binding protein [Gemmatimonadetes bacterium]|nr:ABC transporter ATP-binding protein [Gemmatimonadota bacterium]
MTTLLRVRNLSTSFATESGLARAVDGVSFDLKQGETLGLVGESGCGKTVTALSILRLIAEPPGQYGEESRIEYEGVNLLELSARDLREIRGAQIAMIFQEPMSSLNPVLTVGSQIVEAIRAHGSESRREATERAVELLTLVGIPEPGRQINDYPHQMSGGMQQRVMIAMALSCRPKILIADEPTTALDVTIQAQILDLLMDLKARFGMSVLFITHDLGVLAGIADRVAVMYGGKIVEEGEVHAIFERPAHPYTQGLLRAVPHIDRPTVQLRGIPGAVPTATEWPSGCRFHPRCSQRIDRCSTETPPDITTETEHIARCWVATPAGKSQAP